jgi:hypothetical protein
MVTAAKGLASRHTCDGCDGHLSGCAWKVRRLLCSSAHQPGVQLQAGLVRAVGAAVHRLRQLPCRPRLSLE